MNVFDAAKQVIRTLLDNNHQAYFVGGAVRDQLLGLPVSDIDIATSATPEEIALLFPKTIPVGVKFGIIVVVIDGHNFEVATFREEDDYIDGRHPTSVCKSTMEKDVKRRDFTINGLYYDPLSNKLYDFIGGQKDLDDRIIRAIGDPQKRFEEDHLRMIRAARYSACLNFSIETFTKKAIHTMSPYVKEGLSIERIYQELDKMHEKNCLGKGLEILLDLGLLKHLFPQFNQIDTYQILSRCERIKKIPSHAHVILPLMILFHIEDKNDLDNLVKFFKTSNQALKIGYAALKMHFHSSLSKLEWAELLSLDFADSLIAYQTVLEENPKNFSNLVQSLKFALHSVINSILDKKPIVTAQDLIDLGVPKGPLVKQYMQKAMEDFACNPSFSKEQLISRLKSTFDI